MFVLEIEFDGLKIQSDLRLDNKYLSYIINSVKSQYAFVYVTIYMSVRLNTFVYVFHDCPHIIILK